jgi:putative glutamine amidotransferase
MKIVISPRVRFFEEGDHAEYCIDEKWPLFLQEVFFDAHLNILYPNCNLEDDVDLLIISGGNNIEAFSQNRGDEVRNSHSNVILRQAIEKNIATIGICYGAQFIAQEFDSKISPKKGHIKNHDIIKVYKHSFLEEINEDSVNSYHEYVIDKLGSGLDPVVFAKDDTIEMFMHKSLNIYGIMWHPERYKEFRDFDREIFRRAVSFYRDCKK